MSIWLPNASQPFLATAGGTRGGWAALAGGEPAVGKPVVEPDTSEAIKAGNFNPQPRITDPCSQASAGRHLNVAMLGTGVLMPNCEFPTSSFCMHTHTFSFLEGLSCYISFLAMHFLLCEYCRPVSSAPKCHKSGGLVPVPCVLQSTS